MERRSSRLHYSNWIEKQGGSRDTFDKIDKLPDVTSTSCRIGFERSHCDALDLDRTKLAQTVIAL